MSFVPQTLHRGGRGGGMKTEEFCATNYYSRYRINSDKNWLRKSKGGAAAHDIRINKNWHFFYSPENVCNSGTYSTYYSLCVRALNYGLHLQLQSAWVMQILTHFVSRNVVIELRWKYLLLFREWTSKSLQ